MEKVHSSSIPRSVCILAGLGGALVFGGVVLAILGRRGLLPSSLSAEATKLLGRIIPNAAIGSGGAVMVFSAIKGKRGVAKPTQPPSAPAKKSVGVASETEEPPQPPSNNVEELPKKTVRCAQEPTEISQPPSNNVEELPKKTVRCAQEPTEISQPPSSKESVELDDDFELLGRGDDAPPDTATLGNTVYKAAEAVAAGVSKICNGITPYIGENNAPWKQRIYQLELREIRSELAKELGEPLEATIVGLERLPERNELDNLILDALRALRSSPSGDYRKLYKRHLDKLRTAIKSEEYFTVGSIPEAREESGVREGTVRIVQALDEIRLTRINIFSFLDELVSSITGCEGGAPPLDPTEEEFQAIDTRASQVMGANQTAVAVGCLKGTLNRDFDPHMQTNKPYIWGDLQVDGEAPHTVRWLRMGCPTMEGCVEGAVINPEFKAFIESLDRENVKARNEKREVKKHCYISLQSLIPKGIGDETGRSQALLGLAEHNSDTLRLFVFAQDSRFYKQKGERFGVESMGTEEFQAAFLEQMLVLPSKESGFHFPDEWKREDRREEMSLLLGAVTRSLYGNKQELDIAERQDLIEVYYAALTQLILKKEKPHFFNQTCKDAIDRAGKNAALLHRSIGILAGIEREEQHIRDHRVIVHSGSFTVKKQAILPGRRTRYLTALQRMMDRAEAYRRELAEFRLIGEQPFSIQRKEGQAIAHTESAPNTVEQLVDAFPNQTLDLVFYSLKQGDQLGVHDGELYVSHGGFVQWASSWVVWASSWVFDGSPKVLDLLSKDTERMDNLQEKFAPILQGKALSEHERAMIGGLAKRLKGGAGNLKVVREAYKGRLNELTRIDSLVQKWSSLAGQLQELVPAA